MDIEDAKLLGIVLGRYKDLYYVEVMFAVILVYILYPFKIMPLRKQPSYITYIFS